MRNTFKQTEIAHLVSPAVSKLFCIRNKGDQKKRVFILRKINVNLQVLLAANADKILAYRQVLQTDKEKKVQIIYKEAALKS